MSYTVTINTTYNMVRYEYHYMAGIINEETALVLLKPQKLTDQYAFLTMLGLSALRFREMLKNE